MSTVIKNGKNTPLNQNSGGLPEMSGALDSWLQVMVFIVVTKTVVDFNVVEAGTEYSFSGVWQPMGPQELKMKPEGQRDWKWFQVHTYTQLPLKVDMVIKYQGENYRITKKTDYKEYGYITYDLVNDYTGSGPAV